MELEKLRNGAYLVRAEEPLFRTAADAGDILSLAFSEEARKLVFLKDNIDPAFFDLKTGIAGEVLQKFSNYRFAVAICGDYSGVTSKALRDFIFESNKGGKTLFLDTVEEAVEKM